MAGSGSVNRLLLRIDRISAWILFFLMIAFIVTGYSMSGEYGMDVVVNVVTALKIHSSLSGLLVLFFTIHVGIRLYFALIRWGLIRKASPSSEDV